MRKMKETKETQALRAELARLDAERMRLQKAREEIDATSARVTQEFHAAKKRLEEEQLAWQRTLPLPKRQRELLDRLVALPVGTSLDVYMGYGGRTTHEGNALQALERLGYADGGYVRVGYSAARATPLGREKKT